MGWRAIRKEPVPKRADACVAHTKCFRRTDHPGRAFKGGFAAILDARPPLPSGGEHLAGALSLCVFVVLLPDNPRWGVNTRQISE